MPTRMVDGQDSRKVNASPTKQLFIRLLTRDIDLSAAIMDLVDNCLDGAKRIRGKRSLNGLSIDIRTSQREFEISDNCGGIPVDVARDYAFRFGRAPNAPATSFSIGRFGVGMKRAIFKLGDRFRIISATETSLFEIEEKVSKWEKRDNWDFEFESDPLIGVRQPKDSVGTTVIVKSLHDDVKKSFDLANWRSSLRRDLEARLYKPIGQGLAVSLNGSPISAKAPRFLSDDKLRPVYRKITIPDEAKPKDQVEVELYCGLIGESDKHAAGWHIYCNDRLVLEADTSEKTGWGYRGAGLRSPKFHGQYNNFLGFAFFRSADPDRLPWTTTKTSIDMESAIYRQALLEMVKLMLPVKTFLDEVKKERESGSDDPGPLQKRIKQSESAPYNEVSRRRVFDAPKPSKKSSKKANETRIVYYRPKSKVQEAKSRLDVTTNQQVGEATFDYFYSAEVEDE